MIAYRRARLVVVLAWSAGITLGLGLGWRDAIAVAGGIGMALALLVILWASAPLPGYRTRPFEQRDLIQIARYLDRPE
jgi:hypothetical protein